MVSFLGNTRQLKSINKPTAVTKPSKFCGFFSRFNCCSHSQEENQVDSDSSPHIVSMGNFEDIRTIQIVQPVNENLIPIPEVFFTVQTQTSLIPEHWSIEDTTQPISFSIPSCISESVSIVNRSRPNSEQGISTHSRCQSRLYLEERIKKAEEDSDFVKVVKTVQKNSTHKEIILYYNSFVLKIQNTKRALHNDDKYWFQINFGLPLCELKNIMEKKPDHTLVFSYTDTTHNANEIEIISGNMQVLYILFLEKYKLNSSHVKYEFEHYLDLRKNEKALIIKELSGEKLSENELLDKEILKQELLKKHPLCRKLAASFYDFIKYLAKRDLQQVDLYVYKFLVNIIEASNSDLILIRLLHNYGQFLKSLDDNNKRRIIEIIMRGILPLPVGGNSGFAFFGPTGIDPYEDVLDIISPVNNIF